jgi:ribosome-associated protein
LSAYYTVETGAIRNIDLEPELKFAFSRSSGPGGQHVNKTSTRVELRFNVVNSSLLSDEEKELILENLKTRVNSEGEIVMYSQSERSQARNKERVTERFFELITRALTPKKKRKPTKPGAASREKRLKEKKAVSEKKRLRNDDNLPME